MQRLDDAYEQVNGAREHLGALKPEIEAFVKVIEGGISLEYQKRSVTMGGRQLNAAIGSARFPINHPSPPKVRRIIGETVQCLRKALDYLVYELACHDSKSTVEMTQFVIADSEEEFKKQLWHLRGLSGVHKEMIQRFQPYKGCQWTKLVRDLSNPDKHRTLTAVRHPISISLDPGNTAAMLAGQKVSVDSYASIQVAFNNGMPVMETLDQLVSDVAHTLDAFKPEFE